MKSSPRFLGSLFLVTAGLVACGEEVDGPRGNFQVVPGPGSGLGVRFQPPLRKRRQR